MFQKRRDVFLLAADVEIRNLIVQRFPLNGNIAAQSVLYAQRNRVFLVAADKLVALSSALRNLTVLSGLEPANFGVDATIVEGISVSIFRVSNSTVKPSLSTCTRWLPKEFFS